MASVNGFAFDDKTHYQPQFNHLTASAPTWCVIDDSLEEAPPVVDSMEEIPPDSAGSDCGDSRDGL